MNTPCAVTADLNRYLADLDRADGIEAMIDRRTADLLLSDFDPTKTDMVSEALCESAEKIADAIAIQMGHLAGRVSNLEKTLARQEIGLIIERAINAYCEDVARTRATRSVKDADCGRCFDEGCRHCDPEPDEY